MDMKKYELLIKHSQTLKVLYVEDNEDVRSQVKKMLENYFDSITLAVDGLDGLEKFKLDDYDIVFTDVEMPNMDGIAMLEEMRKLNRNVSTAVFSAYSETDYLLNSISAGVDGYIIKPIDLPQLSKLIQRIVDRLNLLDKNAKIIQLEAGYYWDKSNDTLYRYKDEVILSKNEIALFKLLGASPMRIYSAIDIENQLFHDEKHDNKRIRNLISRLKVKLGMEIVKSIYGQGYKLNVLR